MSSSPASLLTVLPRPIYLLPLPFLSDTEYLADFDRRFPRIYDNRSRTCDHICPRCSTPSIEVFGTWDRDLWQFECDVCGFKRAGDDAYQEALDDYNAECYRARQADQKLRAAARAIRRAGV